MMTIWRGAWGRRMWGEGGGPHGQIAHGHMATCCVAGAKVSVGGGEEIAEDFGGGEGIAPGLFLASGQAGAGHLPVGGGGGEAFVLIVDGQRGVLGEACAPLAYEFGAGAFGVVHVQREAEDQGAGAVLGDLADDRGEEELAAVGDDGDFQDACG